MVISIQDLTWAIYQVLPLGECVIFDFLIITVLLFVTTVIIVVIKSNIEDVMSGFKIVIIYRSNCLQTSTYRWSVLGFDTGYVIVTALSMRTNFIEDRYSLFILIFILNFYLSLEFIIPFARLI